MSQTSIDIFKKHIRVDDLATDDENAYLQSLLDAAEEWLTTVTRRSMDELIERGGGALPKTLEIAVLMLAGHWYDNRAAVSGTSMTEVPYTMSTLVKPYVKLAD